jgi:CRP/FNR family cyclic AMP-dependent transcriptional regulator
MTGVSPAELGSHPFLRGMRADHVSRLAEIASAQTVPSGHRFFEEGGRAEHLWLIRTGCIALDLHVSGRSPLIIETIVGGQLIGLSWISAPYEWQYGAEAIETTEAFRFGTAALTGLCDDDPELGYQVTRRLMEVVAERLHATRIRLIDVYASPRQRAGSA